jgi:hypothetical protein
MTLSDGHPLALGAAPATTRAVTATSGPAATGRGSWIGPLAAAAAVVVALTGGYAVGRHAVPNNDVREQAIANVGQPQPAPAPTSVIRLEPGVDWHEQTARN